VILIKAKRALSNSTVGGDITAIAADIEDMENSVG